MTAFRLAGCIALLSACTGNVGVQVHEFKPAQAPAGIGIEVLLRRNLLDGMALPGELLSVGEDGVLLLLDSQLETAEGKVWVVHTPYWMMRRVKLEQMGDFAVKSEGRTRRCPPRAAAPRQSLSAGPVRRVAGAASRPARPGRRVRPRQPGLTRGLIRKLSTSSTTPVIEKNAAARLVRITSALLKSSRSW